MSKRMLLPLLASLLPAAAAAQARLGPEFQVNALTTGHQSIPVVAMTPGGGFVVVWTSSHLDGDELGVFARRFDAAGIALGLDLQVNSYTTGNQRNAAVAVDGAGNFVVVWMSYHDGDSRGIFGQRFSAAGARRGSEFQVNVYTTGFQDYPAVARDALNGFIVVWDGPGPNEAFGGVVGRRFSAGGTALGGEFSINAHTTGNQMRPAIAAQGSGEFVVLWDGNGPGDQVGVFGRRFAAGGTPAGLDFRVNTHTAGDQWSPSVAVDPTGAFVAAWSGEEQNGAVQAVLARQYTPEASPATAEIEVNNLGTGVQSFPNVAVDAGGNFVVVWHNDSQDGSGRTAVGRHFSQPGPTPADEFIVNTYTMGDQQNPAVAMGPDGQFVVVWASLGQDGSGFGIVGQRFAPDFIFEDGFE